MSSLINPAQPVFFDLSRRVKLRVAGTDALRFLNGQISNDLRKATSDSAIQASVLNAKGRLNAVLYISVDGNSYLLDSDPEVKEELPVRIERYLVADDVQVEDVTGEFVLFHVLGDVHLPDLPAPARSVQVNRFGYDGRDLWFEHAMRDRVFQELSSGFAYCDEECTELLRIERGIPRWGYELTDQIIPTEANLEASSIDYVKGCYVGQEVISRIKSSGQTAKRLYGLVSLEKIPLRSGMRLVADGEENKEVGWVTSATRSQRLDQEIALGYLKRGFGSAGSRVKSVSNMDAGTAGVPVEVVVLPFV